MQINESRGRLDEEVVENTLDMPDEARCDNGRAPKITNLDISMIER